MKIEDFLLSFFPELIGAGLGAYLGYRYGIKQEREIQKEEHNETKNNLIKSILDEIKFNDELLNAEYLSFKLLAEGSLAKVELISSVKLMTNNYDSGIYSGNFSLLKSETKKQVSNYYYYCERLNELTQKYNNELIKFFKNEDKIILFNELGGIEFNPEILQNKVDSLVISIKNPGNTIKALESELIN